ncbi:MAG: ATP-dependent sacrificial sulfur transferase LarE [Spartobacteria bacterium]|nr:ATP-dependent sacrificial sulfur transferase LarE [Spartobacteria bacterium]
MTNKAIIPEASDLGRKLEQLTAALTARPSALVAYSGGVDSSMLAAMAHKALGEHMLAVTLAFPAVPRIEVFEAIKTAQKIGMRHRVIDAPELFECIEDNRPDRCYRCKKAICARLQKVADEEGLACIMEGSNHDELSEHRPGAKALKEAGVLSPLADIGFTKDEIRQLLRLYGIPNAGKPSSTCLATRFPYGTRITAEDLARVERAEAGLNDAGFGRVRVRAHGAIARIEVPPQEIARFSDAALRERIVAHIKTCGFNYATLDLQGYRTGSMDEPDSV